MAGQRLRQVVHHLHASMDAQSDAQLLWQFIDARDETAFAALVRRHGRMVLGVSRRILQHAQDAEDVFQATFLVLARKAHAVVRRETIGTWLYRVAYRTALDAKAMRERRRAQEGQVDHLPQPEAPAVDVHDWRPIVDEELNTLPEKYQGPLVLCDLESWSRKDAALQLRIPEGTLSSRLAKARRMLASRLARRGVTLSAGALATALAADAVSGLLAAHTARVASLMLTGQLAEVSTPVALLVKGALKTMFLARFKMIGLLLLVAGLTLGTGSVAYRPVAAQNPAPGERPLNELDALRRENALLKLNLEVVLEKVRAQAAELEAVKKNAAIARERALYAREVGLANLLLSREKNKQEQPEPPLLDINIEDFLAKLRAAKDDATRAAYAEALEVRFRKLWQEIEAKKAPDSKKNNP
jgi:RNA polymerase sigma factor (sigma-70 family)